MVKTVKLIYFLKNRFLYSQAYIRQTKYIVMMTNERVYQNCKFHDMAWPYVITVNMYMLYYLLLYQYKPH